MKPTALELKQNRLLLSVKENQKIAHIWSDDLEKNLCGIDYMYAYFKPVDGWDICRKCSDVYQKLFENNMDG